MVDKSIFVSIVIPVCNDAEAVKKTLKVLTDQSQESVLHEIIVVDNGSSDASMETVELFPEVVLIKEHTHLGSPYSARNRGIERSKGNIIVLLDATCTPEPNWMMNGVNCLMSSDAGIIGGNVLFNFEGRVTAGKVYDSLTNIRMKESIFQRNVAKTANLFIRREVFDKVGLFPEGIRSGADVRWTRLATRNGVKLLYCEGAVVQKKARTFFELLDKQWRVGAHQPLIWAEEGKKVRVVDGIRKFIIPTSGKHLKILLKSHPNKDLIRLFPKLWIMEQVFRMEMAVANIYGIFKFKIKSSSKR